MNWVPRVLSTATTALQLGNFFSSCLLFIHLIKLTDLCTKCDAFQPLKLIWRNNFSDLPHDCECARILPWEKDQAPTTEGLIFLIREHAIWTWHSLPLRGVYVSWVSQPAVEQQNTTSPTIASLRSHRKHIKLRTPLIHRKWMTNTWWIIEMMVGKNLWRSSNLISHSDRGLSLTWDDVSCDHA